MSSPYEEAYCLAEHLLTHWVCSLDPDHPGQHEAWDAMEVGVSRGEKAYTADDTREYTNPVVWGDAGIPAPLSPTPAFASIDEAERWLTLARELT